MRYFDRTGGPINSLEWKRLYGTRNYAIVCDTIRDGHEIVTSWIGIVHESEAVPKLFLLEVRKIKIRKVAGHEVPSYKVIEERWFQTEAEAKAAHAELTIQEQALCTA